MASSRLCLVYLQGIFCLDEKKKLNLFSIEFFQFVILM